MITTCPLPERRIWGRSAFVISPMLSTFASNIQRQFSSTISATGSSPFAPPALLTSTEAPPKDSVHAANSSMEPESVTSRNLACPAISAASFSIRSTRRAPRATSKPAPAKARAVAAPIPDEAPVTTARRDLFSDTYPPSVFAALSSGPSLFPARRPPPVYSSGRRVSRRLPLSYVPWFGYYDRDFSYQTYQ